MSYHTPIEENRFKCKCGETKKLSLEPTLKTLIFGGHHYGMELRCPKCERKVARTIDKMLKRMA